MSKFTELSEKEVRQIVQDIFSPKKISNVKIHKRADEITCDIYTEWTSHDDNGEEDVTTIKDAIILRNPFDYGEDALWADFQLEKDDYNKLKQFCYAKGIYGVAIGWMFDNPYLEEEK